MKDCDAISADPLTALDAWYRSPLGRGVAEAEADCLESLLEDAFGYFLLQVGAAEPFVSALDACRIRHRLWLQTEAGALTGATPGRVLPLKGELARLPFAADSVDAVVLPHSLDFSPDPHRVLREVDRVLVAEGRVFLFGFNSLSTWGVRRVWPRRRGVVPWCGSRLTLFRVCDWLKLIGFHVEVKRMLVFRPPWRRAFSPRLDWMDHLGGRYWPVFGGVYAVRAVKRLSTLTPLRSSWKPRPSLLPGRAVKPTARESSRD
jgi:SAM-dependent methyltransferase